jgi:iron complex outermembrane receptor protein
MNSIIKCKTAKEASLLLLVFYIFMPLHSQDSFLSDTIRINEVVITSKKTEQQPSGYKVITIDTAVLNEFSQQNLADLLIQKSGIAVKSYGLGGVSTPAFRGTGANHTVIQWNNISINSPMLGQSDISLIPVGLFDEINIYCGGSSLATGSGGLGGIINIDNKPTWNKGTYIVLNPAIGSFGTYSGLVKVKTGNSAFQSVTRSYIQYGKNDFSYLNRATGINPVREKMSGNEVFSRGLVQEIYYRKNRNVLSAKIWYQNSDRNLPSSMLSGQTGLNENQFDESFRSVLNYEGKTAGADYFITGSLNLSELRYINRLAEIDSRNRSESLILKAGFTKTIANIVRARAIFDEDNTLVRSVNYLDNKSRRNLASATIITETVNSGRFGATFVAKEILHENRLLAPDFSGGLQFRLSDLHDHYLKANYSKSSRVPSMNDLYWNPGGNMDLRNETSNNIELEYEMSQIISSSFTVSFNTSLYYNTINDLIQWRPGAYSYWTAENVKKVITSGIESSGSARYSAGVFSAVLDLNYYLTKASSAGSDIIGDESVGKQLIYIPSNLLNGSLHLKYGGIYSKMVSVYTGKRYTDADNTSSLPAYILNSVTTGYEFVRSHNKYNIGFVVDNIFNVSYENIAWYPQPGRSYTLKFTIQFAFTK